jgi:2-dehydro-3-deoxyphosphooctonate aldolase (KDO 8-P synthase)
MRIGDIRVGNGARLVLITGLNVIESEQATLECALAVEGLAERHGLPLVFKASFDKANRSSRLSYRGPGLDEGLRILAQVKRRTGLALLTDVHEPGHAKPVADVADCLQVPAFLSRQTDLIAACAATGRAVNLKKGQFMAPRDVGHAVEKARSFGADDVLVTERGTTFGYNDLVVDMRGLVTMRSFAPVCLDATHAVQHPGAGTQESRGDRSFVAPLARAAVAVGVDALFVEIHPDPDRAPCDSLCQLRIEDLDRLLAEVCAVERALPSRSAAGDAA